jgi:hypothetical protein
MATKTRTSNSPAVLATELVEDIIAERRRQERAEVARVAAAEQDIETKRAAMEAAVNRESEHERIRRERVAAAAAFEQALHNHGLSGDGFRSRMAQLTPREKTAREQAIDLLRRQIRSVEMDGKNNPQNPEFMAFAGRKLPSLNAALRRLDQESQYQPDVIGFVREVLAGEGLTPNITEGV